MVSFFKSWLDSHNLVLILISIYILLSVAKIGQPGVNNDQLMFVNAATLNPDNMFLWRSFHGIPTMVFPYIGALKSYLYMPIFYLFGVNIWSIRLPQIILISITWFLLYKTIVIAFNKRLALLTVLFLCIDPSIISYSKVDVGPTVLEFFLKVLTVYLMYLSLIKKQPIYFFSIFPVLILGIFNKINFIWFANAFLISFAIFYFKDFFNNFKVIYRKNFIENPQNKILPILGFLAGYALVIRFFIKMTKEVTISSKVLFSEMSFINISQNLTIFYNNLLGIINGNIFFNMVYGYNPTPFGLCISLLILITILIGLFYKPSRACYFFIIIVFLIFLQILLTKQAVKPWHTLSIYPFFTILFAISTLNIFTFIKSNKNKSLFLFFISGIIFYQISINAIYINKFSSPAKSIAYSSKIYDLINFTKTLPNKFICLDVDICNQLISFTQQKGKFTEPFFFLDPQTYNYTFIKLSDNFNNPDIFLYIDHSDENSHFPNFRKTFFEYLNENNIKYNKIREFKDGEAKVFEIYKIGYY